MARLLPRLLRPSLALAAALGLLLLLPAALLAADWPQYRGQERDGISPETGLALTWPEERGPRQLWRVPLGDGYSGIAVAGGRLFTMFGSERDELLAAFDPATGEELWRQRIGSNRFDGQGAGPRSTPTVEGGTVYALGASGNLWAVDAATGEKRWSKDLVETFGAKIPQWGVSTSPLVAGELLLVEVGGRDNYGLVGFDKTSGKVRWATRTNTPGYSSPLLVTVGGVDQALFFTGDSLVSVDPESGRRYWSEPWKTSYDVNAAMPVFVPPNRVFLSSAYNVGAALFELSAEGGEASVRKVWESDTMENQFNSSVLVEGTLYGFDNSTLTAISVRSGERLWRERGLGRGSLMAVDDHLIILGERGQLVIARATPEAYRPIAQAQPLDGKTWTMPTLAGGRLFLRDQEEMVALDLSRPSRSSSGASESSDR